MCPYRREKPTREKHHFRNSVDYEITGGSNGNRLLILMDANARTGTLENELTGTKVQGAYRRHEVNESGERLLPHATDNKLALQNTFLATPAGVESYTLQSPKMEKGQGQLDYILIRQADRRLVHKRTVRGLSEELHKSYHNLVVARNLLLG